MKYALAIALCAVFAISNTAAILRQFSTGTPTVGALFFSQLVACNIAMLVLASVI